MKNKIITISRQYGSGGRHIGEIIAKKLGIEFYDKQLIEVVSKVTGINKDFIKDKEEKFTNDTLFFSAFNKEHFSSPFNSEVKNSTLDIMFEIQSNIIKDIAKKEKCVIIGRCANFILKDIDDCFNVFIYSCYKDRIERITKEYGGNINNAEKQLKNMDKYRANYYRYYTGHEWGNIKNYHLMINRECFNDEDVCDIIIESSKKSL